MNYDYNFNFNPNTTFTRSVPYQMPFVPNRAPLPRLSSLFRGIGTGARSAANIGTAAGTINTANAASKITFSGILNGASKTLGVINQAIPVFYQVKPIWSNAKTMFKVVKGLNSDDVKNSYSTNERINEKPNHTKEIINVKNSPTFFD